MKGDKEIREKLNELERNIELTVLSFINSNEAYGLGVDVDITNVFVEESETPVDISVRVKAKVEI